MSPTTGFWAPLIIIIESGESIESRAEPETATIGKFNDFPARHPSLCTELGKFTDFPSPGLWAVLREMARPIELINNT